MRNSVAANGTTESVKRVLDQSDLGNFVTAGEGVGIGRLTSLNGRTARVRFFRGPSFDPYEERDFPRSKVRKTALRSHTRIYLHDGRRWRIGRIDDEHPDSDGRYVVAFPNSEGKILAPESFDVRWSVRIDNPFDFLSALGGDSPLVCYARASLISEWHRQRAAANGVEGLFLGSVELHDHQVTIVRSVADDTSRRYLLSDEVGLGKTIEAGALVWRHLRRNPTAEVLVLAPERLRLQWEEELLGKFHVDHFRDASIRIKAHDGADSWPSGPLDMLVVDEAHHLTRAGQHGPTELDRLAELAGRATDVLLLSATPVRANEVAFLDLLCLLDPDNYRKEDVEPFTQRVEMRDSLALTYQAMTPDLGTFELSLYAKQFQENFPNDSVLHLLADQAAECTDVDRPDAVARLREHLSETYRLHHRLLRTRRTPEISESFGVRGRRRGLPFTVDIDDDSDMVRFGLVEEFRHYLAELVDIGKIDASDAARSFRMLAEACGSLPTVLLSIADSSVDIPVWQNSQLESTIVRWLNDQGDVWRRDLSAYAPIALERTVEKIGHMVLSKDRGKVVVTSAFSPVAQVVAETLAVRYGDHRVAEHLHNQSRDQTAADVEKWRSEEVCRILVCDSSAEEGLNLQAANLIIHLDLPWEAFRLEQRIGRADRFVERSAPPVESTVMMYGDQPFALSWCSFVADACGVFDGSVSSLQYVLSDLEGAVQSRALLEGASALDGQIESHHAALSEEARRITAHDSLDAVGDEHGHLNRLLLDSDADRTLGSALKTWISGVGGKVRHPRRDTMDLAHHPRPQVPFSLELAMAPWFGKELAISRASAVEYGLPILRAGHGLVDAVVEHLAGDDRGVAFAFLRSIQNHWPPTVVFRTDFLVRAVASHHLSEVAAEHELSGWLNLLIDSLTPPVPETVFVSATGAEMVHPSISNPYDRTRGDRNLTSRPELFDLLTSHLNWEAQCERGLDASMEVLARRPSVATSPGEASTTIASMIGSKLSRLRARGNMGIYPVEDQVLAFSRLAAAIPDRLEVTIDVVGCGAIFLADPKGMTGS